MATTGTTIPVSYIKEQWVRIVSKSTSLSFNDLDSYFGKFVKIRGINIDSGIFNFSTIENPELVSSVYEIKYIDRVATEQEIVRILKKIEKKKEQKEALIAKEKEGVIYKPADVGALAVDIFGEERVKWGNEGVMIYFPEFEMTNSKGMRHTIKDLYVRYVIEPIIDRDYWEIGSYKAIVSMQGIRGSLSLKEYQSNYGHSHLNTGNTCWSNFCTGKSEYNLLLQNVQLSLLEEDWVMLFLSLENYLVWESLEGGPYCKIEQMKYQKSIESSTISGELNRILPDMPKDVWDFSEDGLSLNSGHPLLGEYFNSVSKIRDANSYTKEEAEKAVKEGISSLKSGRKRNGADVIEWGEEKRKPHIYYEEVDEKEQKPVTKGIMDEYCNILSKKGKEFIKKYTYGRAKQNNYQKVFGTSGA